MKNSKTPMALFFTTLQLKLRIIQKQNTRNGHLRCIVPDTPFLCLPLLHGFHGHLLVCHFQAPIPDVAPWFSGVAPDLEMSIVIWLINIMILFPNSINLDGESLSFHTQIKRRVSQKEQQATLLGVTISKLSLSLTHAQTRSSIPLLNRSSSQFCK